MFAADLESETDVKLVKLVNPKTNRLVDFFNLVRNQKNGQTGRVVKQINILYTSLCTGELNAIRKHKCFLSSPFYGRACRWAMLGELKPKGPKGPKVDMDPLEMLPKVDYFLFYRPDGPASGTENIL